MMTDWYERTIKALPLNGKGERTQECYTRAVRMLSEFYEKIRDLVSEEELQEYFLHKKNVNKWAPNTMRICYEKCGKNGKMEGKMWDNVPQNTRQSR